MCYPSMGELGLTLDEGQVCLFVVLPSPGGETEKVEIAQRLLEKLGK